MISIEILIYICLKGGSEMKLYLKAIKKLKEYSCNNSIRTHWKILGEVSLSNEESATICFWKLYGGVNTEYISHDKNHQTNIFLQNDDKFIINLDASTSYSIMTPCENREFIIEIYFKNYKNLRRKYIFTYYINNADEFIFKDSKLHLLE